MAEHCKRQASRWVIQIRQGAQLIAENYLGSTVNAPQGRWQKNQDIHWYSRDKESSDAAKAAEERAEEIRRLKEAEAEALAIALGHKPVPSDSTGGGPGTGTGANSVEVKSERYGNAGENDEEKERLKREKA